ncbi:hypothetical protein [Trinickia sp. Y13]|uniref:hypothetical protein n=1 Tax=Trinickia sp. Y13 TaxID=2917807 RepID=UPI002405E132|nr:hypothetical protein [Trinickia sp. Y13]MDG0024932.1 hypothetical protein [Trinickia sp. Y13]
MIAREFFPLDARADLPKVPACRDCNNWKSQLEHYVLAVLPMGGLHPGASAAIIDQVGPRLEKNAALKRALFVGHRDRAIMSPDGYWQAGLSVPFEAEKLATLACYIALGLAWHHWGLQIAPAALANARSFTTVGTRSFEEMLSTLDAANRIARNWGNGVLEYRGLYSRTNPKVTLWQMAFFGGVELVDSDKPGETSRTLFVATSDNPDWIATRGARRANDRAPIGLG